MRSRTSANGGARRAGSAYVAILGASMLVAVIGFAAVTGARVQLRTAEVSGDAHAARLYARSGIELGRACITLNPDWRTARPNGVWVSAQKIEGGSLTVEAVDPRDNDLANWPTDPVVMTATGRARSAVRIEQVTLVPQSTPMSCLRVAAVAGGNFTINNGTLTCDQTVATNGSFVTSGASQVDSRVEAAGSITGTGYLGTRIAGAARRTIPDDSLIDAYVANATPISYGSTSGQIQDELLSPGRNPYGSQTNPQGIYVIDCDFRTFRIRDSRIVGTLVLINPGSGSTIEDSVNMAPASPNMPCLLVRGGMHFEFDGTSLSESSAGRNFNPGHTPYEGSSNNTTNDTFPSRIAGLVYLSGNGTLDCRGSIRGVVIAGGTLTGTGTLNLTFDSIYRDDPPPGFCETLEMVVQPGSWKQVVR